MKEAEMNLKAIWKFSINLGVGDELLMPEGAKILTVRQQHGILNAWALVNPEAKRVSCGLKIYGTGQTMPADPGRFINTFYLEEGVFVFHAFQKEVK